MKELLPIGSVVRLKEATKSLIIVGTTQIDEDGNIYDYISCVFPEGYIDENTFFLFNHEDIEEVKFVGYINAESQTYAQFIKNQEILKQKEEANDGKSED